VREARFAAIAGGGTASHALLALEVARGLEARGHEPVTIQLIGSKRGREERVMAGQAYPLIKLSGRGLVRSWSLENLAGNLAATAGIAWATVQALATFLWHRPRVFVGVGGYASLPPGLAAALLRIPIVLLNADVEPGLANRVLGRFAAACAVVSPRTPLPRKVVTGVPVREKIVAVRRLPDTRREARRALGIPEGRLTVCFTGGSLGSLRINRAAVGLVRLWSSREDLAIYHVTGRRDYEALVQDATAGPANPLEHTGTETDTESGLWSRMVPFENDVQLLYEAADVMVCRAGAMTVTELAATGVPAVLVPLPGAPGDHQTQNAYLLTAAGAGVLLPDSECEPARLESVLEELLGDAQRLEAMAKAAQDVGLRLGHRHAAADLAEVVCSAAENGRRPPHDAGVDRPLSQWWRCLRSRSEGRRRTSGHRSGRRPVRKGGTKRLSTFGRLQPGR
jgi:UDP-N-acetylglucosamine--N-acetylmuramyl-(pentapeptide) pyrophosphoryl-undecaprenol N-acetylglucosamine transferase